MLIASNCDLLFMKLNTSTIFFIQSKKTVFKMTSLLSWNDNFTTNANWLDLTNEIFFDIIYQNCHCIMFLQNVFYTLLTDTNNDANNVLRLAVVNTWRLAG